MNALTTSRLLLRPIIPQDWIALKKVTRDFAASPYWMYDYPFPSEDEKLKAIASHFSKTGTFLSVLLKETGEMIGYICLHDDGESFDIGYCFHSSFHRQGYAGEALRFLMELMHQNLHVQAFTAGTAMRNLPSVHLLKKLGFELLYTEPTSFHKDPSGKDIVFEGGRFIKKMK